MLEGVPAQPYTVIVDTAHLQDGLGDLGAGVPREQLPPTITLTYWVDASARLLRATSDFAGFPVDMTFTGWGADLGIVAPPEDQQTSTLPGSKPGSGRSARRRPPHLLVDVRGHPRT